MQFSGMWQKVAMDADAAKKMNGAGDVLWVVMMAGDWSAVFSPPSFYFASFSHFTSFPFTYLSVRKCNNRGILVNRRDLIGIERPALSWIIVAHEWDPR